MTANIDTLLIALYVFCDDHVIGRRRIGRPPLLSDAELLCLTIAQVLLGFPSQRPWIRYARKNLRHLFPYVPDQSGRRWTSPYVSTCFYDWLVDLVVNEPVAVALQGDQVGVYWIRIYRSTDAAVVIIADVPANPGPSPTNAASLIARQLVNAHLRDLQQVQWFLCYPGGSVFPQTRYSEVEFFGPELSPEWSSSDRDVPRTTIETAIGMALHLLPPHDEVLERVLAVGGSLMERESTDRYMVVPTAEVPPPHHPFRCEHLGQFEAFMSAVGVETGTHHPPRHLRDQFYQQLTPSEYRKCRYHEPDWRNIAAEAVRIVAELGETPEREELERALEAANVRGSDIHPLGSLFGSEPLMWSGDEFIGRQHRACAVRVSGAPFIVRAVTGPPGPATTWQIVDDA